MQSTVEMSERSGGGWCLLANLRLAEPNPDNDGDHTPGLSAGTQAE